MARKEVSEQENKRQEGGGGGGGGGAGGGGGGGGVWGGGTGRERLSECPSFLSISSSLPLFSIESDSIL